MPTKKTTKTKSIAMEKEKVVTSVIPEQVEVTLENKSENPYLIPLSVLAAGMLIAIAIIYKGQVPVGSGTQNKPTVDVLASVGLKTPEFTACLAKKEFDQKIQAQSADAEKAGGQGTPYSIIIAPNGKRVVVPGAYPFEDMKKAIDALLATASSSGPTKKDMEDPIYNMLPVSSADHIQGNPNAPIKIVEFSDLQCPYCKIFHSAMQQVMAEYGPKGQVAWIYRHLPLATIHQHAMDWARESECANQIGGPDKFWAYVDARFQNQGE